MSGDPLRTYTPEEEQLLTQHLRELTAAVHRGDTRARVLDLSLLRSLHAALFGDVRSHAGRIRARGFGSEYLTFGPHRSTHRDIVERELNRLFDGVARRTREVDAMASDHEARDLAAIQLALFAHAEKQEYLDALNHYFVSGDDDPLIDLVLRVYSV